MHAHERAGARRRGRPRRWRRGRRRSGGRGRRARGTSRAWSARSSRPRSSPAGVSGTDTASGTSVSPWCSSQVGDERGDRGDRHALALAELDQARAGASSRRRRRRSRRWRRRGRGPASFIRSTAASVWPSRSRTPPSTARSGRMWPGRCSRDGVDSGSASTRRVCARSAALMPVRQPVGGVDRDRVRGAARILVVDDHQRQLEPVGDLVRHRRADEAGGVAHHPGDRLLARELRPRG